MSEFWLNIAIGPYHIQAKYGSLRLRLTRNEHCPSWRRMAVYALEWPWPEGGE